MAALSQASWVRVMLDSEEIGGGGGAGGWRGTHDARRELRHELGVGFLGEVLRGYESESAERGEEK